MRQTEKILIIDDEEDICYFLSRNLGKKNYQTSFAHSIAEAEKKIANEKPDIVFLDNHLPDGYGIHNISKWLDKLPDMKIVVLSAHDSPDVKAKAYNSGASYFLSKPFTITEINNVLELLLNPGTKNH